MIEHVDLTPTLTIPAGEVLHVRILPWHDYAEVKDSKYIGLRNVKIEGMAFEPGQEGIEQTDAKTKAVKVLRNGMLLIEHKGKTYHITGQVMDEKL